MIVMGISLKSPLVPRSTGTAPRAMIPTRSFGPGPAWSPSIEIAHRRLGPKALEHWLKRLVPSLTERWVEELRERGQLQPGECGRLVERFAALIVALLPHMLGPQRDQVQPSWDRSAQLFGTISAKRGLAAGEVIEELNALRELVIRDLYRDPPAGGTVRLSLREILRLNRALDRAVSHGSVGHTDALFFEFFGPEEVDSRPPARDTLHEAHTQLEEISAEVVEILGHDPTARLRTSG
jgi:hypothetical protein